MVHDICLQFVVSRYHRLLCIIVCKWCELLLCRLLSSCLQEVNWKSHDEMKASLQDLDQNTYVSVFNVLNVVIWKWSRLCSVKKYGISFIAAIVKDWSLMSTLWWRDFICWPIAYSGTTPTATCCGCPRPGAGRTSSETPAVLLSLSSFRICYFRESSILLFALRR